MKRMESACLLQTIVFRPKDDVVPLDAAKAAVREEYASYLNRLERTHTAYCITEEETETDGTVRIRIMRQYNTYPTGDYLN